MLDKLMALMQEITKENVCVAFSGGVDSSLLLKAAVMAAAENHTNVYAVTFQTRLQPMEEIETACKVAAECKAKHVILKLDESQHEAVAGNHTDRCYWCKRSLFQALFEWGEKHQSSIVLEGSNGDDLKVYRPGFRAIQELGARSPLAELGITKAQVREMAEKLNVSVSKRPSAPCMATRIPYNTPLDFTVMEKLDQGEQKLKALGYETVRLRLHGDIVRIELEVKELKKAVMQRTEIVEMMHELGFIYIALDLEGFRSGSMDLKIES